MIARLRSDERGITLTEVLVAMVLSTLVFGVTLSALATVQGQKKVTEDHNESQNLARLASQRLSKELRNLASPTDLTSSGSTLPRSIDRNEPFDFVFRTVRPTAFGSATDANVQRVRYCLSTDGRLWRMEQPDASAAMPATTACGNGTAGWTAHRAVAQSVTNAFGLRPLFTFSGDGGPVTATDASARADISRVRVDIFVDPDRVKKPVEARLATGIQMRNQNREPQSSFTYTVVNHSTYDVQFNGSASQDPESQPLKYEWYDGTTKVGEGIVYQYRAATGGTHTFTLKVYDPAGLEGVATQTMTFTS